jgi:DHA1 family tetracycline resistance protein-like MFS transporter
MMKFDKQLIPILSLTFINILGYTILIPVLPFIVEQYGGSPVTYGALLATYSLFQFLGAPVLGSLSDRFGRRPILIVSQTGTLVSWLIFGIAYFISTTFLFHVPFALIIIAFSRVIDGITGGNVSVANAYLADITDPNHRTKTFGYVGAIIGIGLMIGPAIGGLSNSTQIGFLGTAVLATIMSTLTLILIYKYLPESLSASDRADQLEIKLLDEISIIKKFKKFSENKLVFKLLFIRIFFAFAFTSYISIQVLFVIDAFKLDSEALGILFFLLGLFLIFNQAIMTRKFSERMGDLITFYSGQVFIAVGLCLLILVDNLIAFIFVAYLINLGYALSFSTIKALLTKSVDKSQQGEITGLDESILALVAATAPFVAGVFYSQISYYTFPLFAFVIVLPHLFSWLMSRNSLNASKQRGF